jgi:hypothetical protein
MFDTEYDFNVVDLEKYAKVTFSVRFFWWSDFEKA